MTQVEATAAKAADRLGRLLDTVMTIDFGGRGTVGTLYEAARDAAGAALSVKAARVLSDALKPGSVAMFATGFPVRPWVSPDIGETDGPPGVAGLARAISIGLKAIPVVTVPKAMEPQVHTCLRAMGVLVLDLDAARRAVEGSRPTCVAVVVAREPGTEDAGKLFDTYAPGLVAAVEHPGANAQGIYNSSVGVDISAGVLRIEPLFDRARRAGAPTLSFIDNVNEIGLGSLDPETLAGLVFAGRTAGTSHVDHLVVGTTANWAAYGVVAALSALLAREDLLVSRERDAAAIAAVMSAGGVEGVSGSTWPDDGVDAIPTWVSGHVVDLLGYIARSHTLIEGRGTF